MKADEEVLVVPTSSVYAIGKFEGFSPDAAPYVELASGVETRFMLRSAAETDETMQQIIPYVIFQAPGVDGGIALFRYYRSPVQGEERLHGKASIGVGGHINPIDATARSTAFEAAIEREIREEVQITDFVMPRCVGVINQEHDAVGRVHLGYVFIYELPTPDLKPREIEGMWHCEFVSPRQAYQELEQLEGWSQIALKSLYPPARYMHDKDYIGLNASEAAAIAQRSGLEARVLVENTPATLEFNPDRLNLKATRGVVEKVFRG